MKKQYDFLIILDPVAAADHLGQVTERVNRLIAAGDGEIIRTEDAGNRKFAYPIRHQASGYYLVLTLTMEPEHVNEVAGKIRLDPEVVRCAVAEGIKLSLREVAPIMTTSRLTAPTVETAPTAAVAPVAPTAPVTIEELEKRVAEILEQPTI